MKRFLIYLLAGSCFFTLIRASAAPEHKNELRNRPVVGLVLSGGGARGAAHIGVLKTLEALHIPIDVITGTSMGAVVGGLYAMGYSPQEMEKILADTDWDEMFSDKPPRPQLNYRRKLDDQNLPMSYEAGWKNGELVLPTGLIQGQKLNIMLKSLTLGASQNFDELPLKFRAVAADIETGDVVVMGNGNLATAMRASLSIPGIFVPVEWEGHLLVDGGYVNNVPAKLAQQMGAEVLIVVDLTGKPRTREELKTPLSIINQSLYIQILRNSTDQLKTLGPEDILIQPDTNKYSSTDFKLTAKLVAIGEQAATLKTSVLSKLSIAPAHYNQYLAAVRQEKIRSLTIDKIMVDNQSKLSGSVIKSLIHSRPNEVLNMSVLEADIERLFGLDIFKNVDYEIIPADHQSNLIIKTEEKDWGPKYIRFGMNADIDFVRTHRVNVTASYHMLPLGSSGNEWRIEAQYGYDKKVYTEFYQPLDKQLRYFVKPWANYIESNFEDVKLGTQGPGSIAASTQVGINGGRLLGNWGSISLGINSRSGDSQPDIGDLSIAGTDWNSGSVAVNFGYDQLDSMAFPSKGALVSVNWISNRAKLGADWDQNRLRMNGLWANSINKNTVILWASFGGIIDSETYTESGYTLGGLFSLSGYGKYDLTGRYAGIARLIYLRSLSNSHSVIKIPFYIGTSVEAGSVWNENHDVKADSLIFAGSFFMGLDTPIGPLYIAKGVAEGRVTQSYLFLGRTFAFF